MQATHYPSATRGTGEAGWLHTRYSFSFAHYFNPQRRGFGALLVVNDDIVEPNNGFGLHHHDNMEIITVVLEGTLTHEDTAGNRGTLRAGEVQVMSAGSGISHSEYNNTPDERLALLQLWIQTKERGITPQYAQKAFTFPENTLVPVASGLADTEALIMHQDARVMLTILGEDGRATHTVGEGRGIFVFVIEGTCIAADTTLAARDALEILNADEVVLEGASGAQVMLVEVPM